VTVRTTTFDARLDRRGDQFNLVITTAALVSLPLRLQTGPAGETPPPNLAEEAAPFKSA